MIRREEESMVEQKSERKFHFLGVLLGVAVDNLGTLISTALIGGIYFANRPVDEQDVSVIYSNVGLLLLLLVVGLFWSFLLGKVPARAVRPLFERKGTTRSLARCVGYPKRPC